DDQRGTVGRQGPCDLTLEGHRLAAESRLADADRELRLSSALILRGVRSTRLEGWGRPLISGLPEISILSAQVSLLLWRESALFRRRQISIRPRPSRRVAIARRRRA